MNLARGLEVLRAFTSDAPVLANRDIAEITGLPKPTISRLTYTLTLMGYLSRDLKLQKYRLGPGVLSLAHPLLATLPARQIAKPMMESLARQTGCSVNLGLRDRVNVVYIESVRADKGNQDFPDIGTTRPLLASAIGRALILVSAAPEQAAILSYLKLHNPALFDKHRASFERDKRLFSSEGYCYSPGDWRQEILAVAVPVPLPGGEALAMNCTLYEQPSAKDKLMREVVPLLKEAARSVRCEQDSQGPDTFSATHRHLNTRHS
jgi:DNA-binding IclR family transcriptional regulator